jgi:hypothetical protein
MELTMLQVLMEELELTPEIVWVLEELEEL